MYLLDTLHIPLDKSGGAKTEAKLAARLVLPCVSCEELGEFLFVLCNAQLLVARNNQLEPPHLTSFHQFGSLARIGLEDTTSRSVHDSPLMSLAGLLTLR